jgi:hypothetical protein
LLNFVNFVVKNKLFDYFCNVKTSILDL